MKVSKPVLHLLIYVVIYVYASVLQYNLMLTKIIMSFTVGNNSMLYPWFIEKDETYWASTISPMSGGLKSDCLILFEEQEEQGASDVFWLFTEMLLKLSVFNFQIYFPVPHLFACLCCEGKRIANRGTSTRPCMAVRCPFYLHLPF